MFLSVLIVCSFLLLNTILLCDKGTTDFIYSPVNEHLGYFPFGALAHKVTKNILVFL